VVSPDGGMRVDKRRWNRLPGKKKKKKKKKKQDKPRGKLLIREDRK